MCSWGMNTLATSIRSGPPRIKLPFDKEVRIIIYMGRLVEFKGVEYLIRAFQTIERELTTWLWWWSDTVHCANI